MAYIYDDSGKRYRVERDDDNSEGGAILVGLLLALAVALAPGMVVTSLFAGFIGSTLWAWIWSVVFSAGIFFLVYWLYAAGIQFERTWAWTIGTYVVLSGLSIWLLIASEAKNIVRIVELLFG